MRILRGLRSTVLPCGCVAGVYETYEGKVVTLIDSAHTSCADPAHKNGSEVPAVSTQK